MNINYNNTQISNKKTPTFGTKFSPELQKELKEAARRSLLNRNHLKYIKSIKNDGLPTTLDIISYYTPGEKEVIITSPKIEELQQITKSKLRGRMVWKYNRETMKYSFDYKTLADIFSPKSALKLNIKWAEEFAQEQLKYLAQKKSERISPEDITKLLKK